jgi:transcriptional regulator with XRE-family HTH domain
MDVSRVIAQNLARLMASDVQRDTLVKVSKLAGVGFGTVRRAKNADGNLTVQNLELIAQAFGRSARDLLLEPLSEYADSPPVAAPYLAESSSEEQELLKGYREASAEVRDIMLDLARKAVKKKLATARQPAYGNGLK